MYSRAVLISVLVAMAEARYVLILTTSSNANRHPALVRNNFLSMISPKLPVVEIPDKQLLLLASPLAPFSVLLILAIR